MNDQPRGLLPAPRTVRPRPGRFWFAVGTPVRASRGAANEAAAVRLGLGGPAAPGDGAAPGEGAGVEQPGVVSVARDTSLPPEGYRLRVAPDRVEIAASDEAGAFYAAQTLRQCLGADAWRAEPLSAGWPVACAEIEDWPSLPWRGAHLDVARHFLPKRDLLGFIDAIAAHKLNTLHLHLTDDQGWRVESRAHPALHERGSHRPRTMISLHGEEPPVYDEVPHGGYYTLADLAEIARYAARRMITVIPEIDVPGHASALLAAVPELGSGPGGAYEVATGWGVLDPLLAPLPATAEFLGAVFTEVLAAAPARFLHLGGDECVLDGWRADPRAQERRASLGLPSMEALHCHFLRELADSLAGQGVRAVVWDEGFESAEREPGPGLRPDTVVMAWRSIDIARRAALAGHDVVMTPESVTYFDHDQSDDAREPAAITGPTPIEAVAQFAPVAADWPEAAAARVLGTQFQLWTEYIRDPRALAYMAFPRACALAEVAWRGGPADWPELADRLAAHLPRLDAMGVEYRPLSGPRPWQEGGTGPRRHRRSF